MPKSTEPQENPKRSKRSGRSSDGEGEKRSSDEEERRASDDDQDLKSREYRDKDGNIHHHTRKYMEQHKNDGGKNDGQN